MQRFLWIVFFLFPLFLLAQNDFVVVDSIVFNGNKKTKEATIRREMNVKEGDRISLLALPSRLEENRTLILNTTLFTLVKVNVGQWKDDNHITITVDLQEQWYLYPLPIFELADRNFNVWWTEQNKSLKRVNLGLWLTHYNFTGRRDKLKLTTQFGYTQKYELDYTLPYFNKKQTLGFDTNLFYATQKETNYITDGDKFLFFGNDQVQLRNVRLKFGLTYRPKLFVYHNINLEYHDNQASDSIVLLNPDFFLHQATEQRFFALRYSFTIDRRDLRDYPKKGFYFLSILSKDGFGIFNGIDGMTLNTTFAKYFTFGSQKKWSTELIWKGLFYLYQKKQPYYNSRSLGSRPDYLRGYELYVIDGTDFTYIKTSLRREIFNRNINWGKASPIKQFRIMPLQVYLTLNNDVGYARDPFYNTGNPLTNSWLWGGGIGLDIVAYVDKVVQIEYSFNHLWENGLFLHYKFTF